MDFKFCVLLCMLATITSVNGIALMSLDLGSEWMKIAVVSPGVPMEIALNKESKRKTLVNVAFRNNERFFGEDALNVGLRFPKNNYVHLLQLLGKKVDHPIVQNYIKRFPFYDIFPHPETGTVVFKHNENTNYTPEELMAMVISYAKEMAESFTGQIIKDCVITVPPYFGQPERRAMLLAASIAGVKVLQLINVNTAVALNYGIFRRNDFNSTAKNILFFDMGATSTIATVASFHTTKTKERGISETHPQLNIMGVGYDQSLGGLEIQARLRSHLAEAFNNQKKSNKNVFENHRAMTKLLKEAGRLKNILSANSDHTSQIEGLMDEIDFKHHVTRETLESLCVDLYDRIEPVIKAAIDQSELSPRDIDHLILVGAGTRAPKVQEVLSKITGMELGKSLNTDEAAAMGAVYKAADLGTGFKVKKFITKDTVLYPIQVDFERELSPEESSTENKKIIRRTLFGPLNPYPQKKVLGFNRHVKDFVFYVNHGEMPHILEPERQLIGSMNLTEVDVKGVEECLAKESGDNVEKKGIKAHFVYDESGLIDISHVECVFEKTIVEGGSDSKEEESTLSKLGSKISSFFSGGEEETQKEETETKDSVPNQDDKKQEKETSEAGNEKTDHKSDKPLNEGDNVTKSTENEKKDVPKKTKVVTVKYPISFTSNYMDVNNFSEAHVLEFIEKIKKLDTDDRLKREREQAMNNLESFAMDVADKLNDDEYIAASLEDDRTKILAACSEISDWMYEDGSDASTDIYKEKLKTLQTMTKDIFARVKEHRERPQALTALTSILNGSHVFLQQARNLSEEEQYFTAVELETLEKLIKDTEDWQVKMTKEQEAESLASPVKLTVLKIAEKINSLDREVKYLINKAKTTKARKAKEEAQKKFEALKANLTSSLNLTDEDLGKLNDIKSEDPSTDMPDETTEPLDVGIDSKDVPVEENEQEEHSEL